MNYSSNTSVEQQANILFSPNSATVSQLIINNLWEKVFKSYLNKNEWNMFVEIRLVKYS